MSFQDIETGRAPHTRAPSSLPQSREDAEFLGLQSSLSLQVFKINSNVQAILKYVDQLGTNKDSAGLRKTLCVFVLDYVNEVGLTDGMIDCVRSHDLTDATRSMAKRGSEDLKKLAGLQAPLVSISQLGQL